MFGWFIYKTRSSVSDNEQVTAAATRAHTRARKDAHLLQDRDFSRQRFDVFGRQALALDALDRVLLARRLVDRVTHDRERARADHLPERVLLLKAVGVWRAIRAFRWRALFVHDRLLLDAIRVDCRLGRVDHFRIL